jgi:hypothetical protein
MDLYSAAVTDSLEQRYAFVVNKSIESEKLNQRMMSE